MMNAPINPVDDGKRRSPQLIVKAAGDETTDYRLTMALTFERPG